MENTTEEKPVEESAPISGNEPKSDGEKASAPTMYTEAQYKGLQAVIAKRDGLIAELKKENLELEAKLAEAQANHGSAVSEKTSLATKLEESTKSTATLTEEVAALKKKLRYQEIVMKEFPDLSSTASFIPDAPTEDEFRTKAVEFRSALTQYVNNGVKNVLGGSSHPISSTTGIPTLGADEEDKAYRDATALAGKPGKEKEYKEAYDRYLQILSAKQKDK